MKKVGITFVLFWIHLNLAQAITNGAKAKENEFPWQVSLQRGHRHICGASIISPRHILTAAHCVRNIFPRQMRIKGGSADRSKQLRLPRAKRFHIHPQFPLQDSPVSRADIAIIELKEKIELTESIRPIELIKKDLRLMNESLFLPKLTVSGWGRDQNGELTEQLNFIEGLELLPPRQSDFWNDGKNLNHIYPLNNDFAPIIYHSFQTEDFLGVVTSNQQSPCKGDSGGPLVLRGETNYLVGVVSLVADNSKCAQSNTSFFTDVDLFSMWIQKVLKQ